ncbi:hypothetical protein KFU94_59220 [Chloroflexi bacterium TSY]|nr:hypothetical protein [Chloroflexi bacterium TSY]
MFQTEMDLIILEQKYQVVIQDTEQARKFRHGSLAKIPHTVPIAGWLHRTWNRLTF